MTEDLRALAAQAAGLPAELAARLRGESAAELAADAQAFAEALGVAAPTARTEFSGSFDAGARVGQPTPAFTTLQDARELARRDPERFNALVDNGTIDLRRLS